MTYITAPDGKTAVDMPQVMQRPDGTPSKTGIRLVPGKSIDGGVQPVATTAEQVAELAEILDAVPLSPARKLQVDAVKTQLAKQENDAALRGVLREEISLQARTVQSDGTELPRSTSAEQEHERVLRAREVARSLGYDDLVRDVRFDRQLPGMGGFGRPDSAATQIYGAVIPGYSVVAGLGTLGERFVYGGEIAALEVVLQLDLNERAQVKRELDLIEVNRARIRQDAADAYTASPAGQIAALRAELAAVKASVAPPASQVGGTTLDDRMAELAAQGITVEVEPDHALVHSVRVMREAMPAPAGYLSRGSAVPRLPPPNLPSVRAAEQAAPVAVLLGRVRRRVQAGGGDGLMELVKSEAAADRFIVPADKLQVGDRVSEFDDTVKSVRASDRYAGIREVTFDGADGTFYLFFADWYHVVRPPAAEGDEHQDDAPVRTKDWERLTVDRSQLPAPRGKTTVHPSNPMMNRVRAWVVAQSGGFCWLCGHGPHDGRNGTPRLGLDHVVPLAECEVRNISPYSTANLRAAHTRQPCPVCQAAAAALGNKAGFCNAMRGAKSPEAARLLIARRTGLVILGTRPDGPGSPVNGERPW